MLFLSSPNVLVEDHADSAGPRQKISGTTKSVDARQKVAGMTIKEETLCSKKKS